MTHTQTPGVAAEPAPFLSERENQRAVDLIEQAERAAPYCLCGRHMLAVADGSEIWLQCSSLRESRAGLRGLLSRATAFSHSRRRIMHLPTAG
jgi:hypothetical protein